MKDKITRALPYVVIVLDIIMLWANATNNDWITLDNLRTQMVHFTGHWLDIRWYDWIFDCLQSLPEKYSDFCTEEYSHHLAERLYSCKFNAPCEGYSFVLQYWTKLPDCILPNVLPHYDDLMEVTARNLVTTPVVWLTCTL